MFRIHNSFHINFYHCILFLDKLCMTNASYPNFAIIILVDLFWVYLISSSWYWRSKFHYDLIMKYSFLIYMLNFLLDSRNMSSSKPKTNTLGSLVLKHMLILKKPWSRSSHEVPLPTLLTILNYQCIQPKDITSILVYHLFQLSML